MNKLIFKALTPSTWNDIVEKIMEAETSDKRCK
jgi:hypothetical protein